jgi:colanic acid biosynthesis glycosyl transferase WcaI
MKILFSTFVYYPEPIGLREHDLAAGLVKLGHDVTVITGLPSYPAGIVFDGYRAKENKWDIVDGVKIFRIKYVGERGHSPSKRILGFLRFTFLSILALFSQKIKPECVRAYQFGLPGYFISLLKGIPFFLDVQDMWPEWAKTKNFNISQLLFRMLDWQQRMIYNKAVRITTISKRFKEYLVGKGVPASKILIISNWAGSSVFKVIPRNKDFGIQEKLEGIFNIVYAGNIGPAQGLEFVLQSAKHMGDITRLQFIFIGDGIEKDKLQGLAHKLGLDNIRFLGSKEPYELPDYFAWADLLLIPLRNNPVYEVTIPSKTFAYLACGRPILVMANGDVADLISDIHAGIVVPPENPHALAQAIHDFMCMSKIQREQYGINAQAAYQKRFNREVLIREYERMIGGPLLNL